jgi:hypothetical protein
MASLTEADNWGWHKYGAGYWQRDDGLVNISGHKQEGFLVTISHRRYRHYSDEVLGEAQSLRRAVLLGEKVPIDRQAAARQRALLEGI